jgi:hypothetical protein
MPLNTSPKVWEMDLDSVDCEMLFQLCSTNTDSANQMLLEGSYTDQAWSSSNQSFFPDLSPLQSTFSGSSSSICTPDWDILCEPQLSIATQWPSSDLFRPCDSQYFASVDTHEGFQSACEIASSPAHCASPSSLINAPTFCNRETSDKDILSAPTAAHAIESSPPVRQDSAASAFRSWDSCQSPADDAKPAAANKRGRPRKIRATSEPSNIASFSRQDCAQRVPHHQVERKYREGLNTSLRQLQRAVPTHGAFGTTRPSKAMVIAGAIDYIHKIEKERDEAVQKVKDSGCSMG